jgi:hypothetical protein
MEVAQAISTDGRRGRWRWRKRGARVPNDSRPVMYRWPQYLSDKLPRLCNALKNHLARLADTSSPTFFAFVVVDYRAEMR